MHCKNCDYALWNLISRTCPECGDPFAPTEFEFHPNSVEFRCPHCSQQYFGTSPTGHLTPPEFDCVNCGQHITTDEMVLNPAPGVSDEQTMAGGDAPWLEQSRYGAWARWWKTATGALIAPSNLGIALERSNAIARAWWFMLVSVVCISALRVVVMSLCMGLLFGALLGGGGFPGGMTGPLLATGAVQLVGVVIITPIFLVIWALSAHGLLLLTGGTKQTIGHTFVPILYGSSAMLVSLIPLVGSLVAFVWWSVSSILILRKTQGVSGGRASLAVLTLPLISIGTVIGLYIWFIVTLVGGGAFTGATLYGPQDPMSFKTAAQMQSLYSGAQPTGPEHATTFLGTGYVTPDNYLWPGSNTTLADVPVGSGTLLDFVAMSQNDAINQLAADPPPLPQDVVAHRVGDYVFTYHGFDMSSPPDPWLWFGIVAPDPDSGNDPGDSSVQFLRCDGTTLSAYIDDPSYTTLIDTQNDLRAQYDLPPLPDPFDVTHDAPAVEGP